MNPFTISFFVSDEGSLLTLLRISIVLVRTLAKTFCPRLSTYRRNGLHFVNALVGNLYPPFVRVGKSFRSQDWCLRSSDHRKCESVVEHHCTHTVIYGTMTSLNFSLQRCHIGLDELLTNTSLLAIQLHVLVLNSLSPQMTFTMYGLSNLITNLVSISSRSDFLCMENISPYLDATKLRETSLSTRCSHVS